MTRSRHHWPRFPIGLTNVSPPPPPPRAREGSRPVRPTRARPAGVKGGDGCHEAGDVGGARRSVRCGCGDLGGQVTSAVAVVDVHHRYPWGAGVEHRQQRRQTFEGGPVSDRGRDRDHRGRRPARRPHWEAHRPFRRPPLSPPRARNRSRWRRIRCRPATPTSVTTTVRRPSTRRCAAPPWRRAGRTFPRRRSPAPVPRTAPATRRPPQQPRFGVVASLGQLVQYGRGLLAPARVNSVRTLTLAQSGGDQSQLGGSLELAVDRLGVSAAPLPVEVEVGHRTQFGRRLPVVASGSWRRLQQLGAPTCGLPAHPDRPRSSGHQRQCERTGLRPAQVDAGEPEPAARTPLSSPVRVGSLTARARSSVGHLDAGDVTVLAHARFGKAQPMQHLLGVLDLPQFFDRHRLVVRNPRRQAWRSRLVRYRKPKLAPPAAHPTWSGQPPPADATPDGSGAACAPGRSGRSHRRHSPRRRPPRGRTAGELVVNPAEQLLLAGAVRSVANGTGSMISRVDVLHTAPSPAPPLGSRFVPRPPGWPTRRESPPCARCPGRAASASKTEESTPPENATPSRPVARPITRRPSPDRSAVNRLC